MGGDTLVLDGAVDQTSVYGGSLTATSDDGADSIDFTSGATLSFVQLNGGNDTLDFSAASAQSTVYGGAGADSITVGGSQLTVKGQKGGDTLNITASSASPPSMVKALTTPGNFCRNQHHQYFRW